MSLTDVNIHHPENFMMEYDKNPYRIYDCINIYNTDSLLPMQKYMFMITDAKVLGHRDSILNISMSVNNILNEQVYSFIRTLEDTIGVHLRKQCKSNFNKSSSMVSICLYSKNMLMYDDSNNAIKITKLQADNQVSVIIKLIQVISDEVIYTPIWHIIQLKLHKNNENVCMFCDSQKQLKKNIPSTMVNIKIPSPPPMEKLTFEKPTKFAPSIADILQTKNCLRKTDPPIPKCAIIVGDVPALQSVQKPKKKHTTKQKK